MSEFSERNKTKKEKKNRKITRKWQENMCNGLFHCLHLHSFHFLFHPFFRVSLYCTFLYHSEFAKLFFFVLLLVCCCWVMLSARKLVQGNVPFKIRIYFNIVFCGINSRRKMNANSRIERWIENNIKNIQSALVK